MKIGIVQTADAPAEIAVIPDWLDGAFTLSATLDRQSLARWRRQHPWPADSRHAHYLNGLMPAD